MFWRETIDNYFTKKAIESDDFLITYWYYMYKINSWTHRVLKRHIERNQNTVNYCRPIDF